jgi:hypothetical protein
MSPVDVRALLLTNQERESPHTRIDDVRGDGTAWSSRTVSASAPTGIVTWATRSARPENPNPGHDPT